MKKLIIAICIGMISLYGMKPRIPLTISSSEISVKGNKNFGKTHFIVGYPTVTERSSKVEDKKEEGRRNTTRKKKDVQSRATVDNDKMTQAFFTSRHDVRSVLASLLSCATTSILVAAFALTDQTVAHTLHKAHASGIKVEVITDAQNMQERYSKIDHLVQKKVPVYYYDAKLNVNPQQKDSRYARMHHKFLVIDETVAITGSTNLTKSGQKDNIENIIIVRDPDTVQDFMHEFEHLKKMCVCKATKE